MDARIRRHASIVVNHSLDLEEGDNVLVSAPADAADLVVALHEALGDIGANPVTTLSNERANRAFLQAAGADGLETPSHRLALAEETDAFIRIRGGTNVTELGDVAPEIMAERSRVNQPISEIMMSKDWCLTQYPSSGYAQLAEMSTDAYQNFVWDAIDKDWDAQHAHQAEMVDRLDAASEVRIVSGESTDLTMSVDGMVTINDDGHENLPGGEVFTAPVLDSVEGTVLFDMPLYHQGKEVIGAQLVFENGVVVDHSAEKNESVLTSVLETDDGARRLGELGIGMNRDIDQFTYNMLFDEKMGDTVHLALGRAYPETVGDGNEANESATHVDMIVDMSEQSRIELDGELVQRDGTFVFEDGFETA